MQRWIVAAVVFVVLGIGGLSAAYFGYHKYKQNRPTQIWLPIPTKPDLELKQRREIAAMLKTRLSDLALLKRVSQDTGYASEMGFANDDEAAKDLQQRLFSEVGTADTPSGKVASINVGFNCKVKEFGKMGKATNRLMDDISAALGAPRPDPLEDEL
jgi:hypothetical protein